MPSIQVVPHADLTPVMREQILALCSDAYEEDFTANFDLLAEATHVLVREAGELVAHAAWVAREVRVGPRRTPLCSAYVEAVATPVRRQRQGFGTRVLRALPPLLRHFDIAVLSPSEPHFYARCGWELWQGPLSYIENGRRIATPDETVMIYRLPRTPPDLDLRAPLETDWRPGDVW